MTLGETIPLLVKFLLGVARAATCQCPNLSVPTIPLVRALVANGAVRTTATRNRCYQGAVLTSPAMQYARRTSLRRIAAIET